MLILYGALAILWSHRRQTTTEVVSVENQPEAAVAVLRGNTVASGKGNDRKKVVYE
jgi:hypothetical protein